MKNFYFFIIILPAFNVANATDLYWIGNNGNLGMMQTIGLL